MNTKDFAKLVAEKLDISIAKADQAIKAILELAVDTAKEHGNCRVGRGSFKRITRAARKCHNPLTGAIVQVPEKTLVRYQCIVD